MLGNKKIVLDADGVMLNFNDRFRKHASEVLNRDIIEVCKSYDLSVKLGITKEEFDYVWETFGSMGCWKDLDPLPGAKEAIQYFRSEGYDIYVVTGIDEMFKADRLENLMNAVGLIPTEIYCVGHGRTYKDVQIDIIEPVLFVDDRLEQLHTNQNVPLLVWVDHQEEQHIFENKRHDHTVSSLGQFVENLKNNKSLFEDKIQQNLYNNSKKNKQLKFK